MKSNLSRNEFTPHKHALSYSEFAEREGISLPTARRMVKRYNLKVMRLSTTLVRIPLSEIERFEAEATC
jgi:excisionase family DNA binding protein